MNNSVTCTGNFTPFELFRSVFQCKTFRQPSRFPLNLCSQKIRMHSLKQANCFCGESVDGRPLKDTRKYKYLIVTVGPKKETSKNKSNYVN